MAGIMAASKYGVDYSSLNEEIITFSLFHLLLTTPTTVQEESLTFNKCKYHLGIHPARPEPRVKIYVQPQDMNYDFFHVIQYSQTDQ